MSVCRLDPIFYIRFPKVAQESQRKLAPIPVLHGGQHIPKGPWQLRAPPGFAKPPASEPCWASARRLPTDCACGPRGRLWSWRRPEVQWKTEERNEKWGEVLRICLWYPWNGVCVFHIIPIFFPYSMTPRKCWKRLGNEGEEWRNDGKNWENGQTPKKALGNQGEIMGIIWKNYEKS